MFDEDSFFTCVIAPFMLFVIILTIPFIIIGYKSSCVSARLYNSQNNTTYTCSDFFWASNQINSQTQTIKIK